MLSFNRGQRPVNKRNKTAAFVRAPVQADAAPVGVLSALLRHRLSSTKRLI